MKYHYNSIISITIIIIIITSIVVVFIIIIIVIIIIIIVYLLCFREPRRVLCFRDTPKSMAWSRCVWGILHDESPSLGSWIKRNIELYTMAVIHFTVYTLG